MPKKQVGAARTKIALKKQLSAMDDVQIAEVLTQRYGKPYRANTVRFMRLRAERKLIVRLSADQWIMNLLPPVRTGESGNDGN